MKKVLVLILAVLMALSLFSACGEEKQQEDPSGAGQPGTGTPVKHEFASPEIEAVVVTAEAYLARGRFIQYEDSRLIERSLSPTTYRFEWNEYSPEDCTERRTGYVNCATFTYDVFREALDYDIVSWTGSSQLRNADYQKYYYKPTGTETEEEKERIAKEFMDALTPGDIVVVLYGGALLGGGHAMLYVGGDDTSDNLIHCGVNGSDSYNYSKKTEVYEAQGGMGRMGTDELLYAKSDKRYLFACDSFGIASPLTAFKGEIPEKTKNRVSNLQGVIVQKLSTCGMGATAAPNSTLTFTYKIQNTNKWPVSLTVQDKVPEHTEYLNGCDNISGRNMSWSVNIAAGDTAEVTYSVRVENNETLYGTPIHCADGSVGGVSVKCPDVYIGAALLASEQDKIVQVAKAAEGSAQKGHELVCKLYGDALGAALRLDGWKSIISSLYKTETPASKGLDMSSQYAFGLAPTLYGGYNIMTNAEAFGGNRTRGPQVSDLMIGDVIITADSADASDARGYMYAGGGQFLALDGEVKLLSILESAVLLRSLIGYYSFAVIRPVMMYR